MRRRRFRGREGGREERRLPQTMLHVPTMCQGHGLAPRLRRPGRGRLLQGEQVGPDHQNAKHLRAH